MKNNLFWTILLLFPICFTNYAKGQPVNTIAQSSYIRVNTYDGIRTQNAFGLQVMVPGENTYIPNWNLMVNVLGEIKNADGKVIDPARLKISLHSITENGTSIQPIGTTAKSIVLSKKETTLIKNSKIPLSFTAQPFYMSFDILVEGGGYLESLKSLNQYEMRLNFSIQDQNEQLISQSQSSILLQLTPQ